MCVKILYRKILHSVEHFGSHFVEEALGYICHKLAVKRYGNYRKRVEADKQKHFRYYLCACARPITALRKFADDRQHFLQEYCGNGGRHGGKDYAYDRYGNKNGIELEEHFQNSFQNTLLHFRAGGFILLHALHLRSSAVHILRGICRLLSSVRHAYLWRKFCRFP